LIALLGGDGVDANQLKTVRDALTAEEAVIELIAAHAGTIFRARQRSGE
jgi:hypothetical protein